MFNITNREMEIKRVLRYHFSQIAELCNSLALSRIWRNRNSYTVVVQLWKATAFLTISWNVITKLKIYHQLIDRSQPEQLRSVTPSWEVSFNTTYGNSLQPSELICEMLPLPLFFLSSTSHPRPCGPWAFIASGVSFVVSSECIAKIWI